jgi:mRNA interferase MazF
MKLNEKDFKQGDICLVDFNPTKGNEITKIRPALIINGNFATGFDLKIVAPITSWREDFEKIWWLVQIPPTKKNGLDNQSAVNCYQIRCISKERIIKKLGNESDNLDEIIATAQNCIEII